jgi:hypothetical protein
MGAKSRGVSARPLPTFEDVLLALQDRLGREVRVHIEGPGPSVLARFVGTLDAAHDLTRRDDPDDPDAGVFVRFAETETGFLLEPRLFVAGDELHDGRLLRIEQRGEIAFMVESGAA